MAALTVDQVIVRPLITEKNTDLMNKDLGLAMEAAQHSKSVTPLGALAKQLYALHATHGNGKLDFSSILKLLQH